MQVKHIPVSYFEVENMKTPTCKKLLAYKNKKILICDFSFNEKMTQKLITNNDKVYIIDHHKTALENLKNINEKHKLIDMNHSGAHLVWTYFYPKKEIPPFVALVEDYDLWTYDYKNTKPFTLRSFINPV